MCWRGCRVGVAVQQMALASGNGADGPGGGTGGLDVVTTALPGNWALPAGPRGYTAARPGRLRARAQR